MTRSTCGTPEYASHRRSIIARLLPLNLVIFLGFMTVSLPLPVLPLYARATFGSSALMVGLLVGIQSIATVLTRPYAGRFADAKGARAATLIGLLICTAAGGLYLVSTVSPLGLGVLFVGRITLGLGESLVLTGAITWGIARVGPAHAGQVMSWNGIAMYAALAAGAPVGLFLYQLFASATQGFTALGLLSVALPGIALAFAIPLASSAPAGVDTGTRTPVLRRIWPFGIALMFLMAGYGAIAAFYSLYFEARGWHNAGFGFASFGIAVIAVRIAFGHLPDRLGGLPVAFASIATATVGQALIWCAPTSAVAIAGATLTGAGVALGFPALGVEALARVPGGSKGMVIALFSAFQDLAFGLTGPVAGLVMLSLDSGNATAFALATLTATAAFLLLLLTNRSINSRPQ